MLNSLFDYQSIDIDSLVSSEPRSAFSPEQIEKLANSFLALGGNIKPLIVEAISLDEFEILYGHLEYHGAIRAMAIDDSFEMVKGIIVNSKNRDVVIEQYLETFTDQSPISNESFDHNGGGDVSGIKGTIANLERGLNDHFDHKFTHLASELKNFIDLKLGNNQVLLPSAEDHLAAFNNLTQHNAKQLMNKLEIAGFTGKKAETIVNAIAEELKKGKFVSFQDVIDRVKLPERRTRAITEKSMIKILDTWSKWMEVKS